jgi:hypothetical protein
MNTRRRIEWRSWNALIEEHQEKLRQQQTVSTEYSDEGMLNSAELIPLPINKVVYTPVGVYPEDSILKPSDRWDCWMASTNFKITGRILNVLNEEIDGIELLKITGTYSFFIGVARLFKILDVRKQIDEKICSYTELEILSNLEIEKTVTLMKNQLQEHNYWSMLIYPEGHIEYAVSNEINIEYLNEINTLVEKKNNFGGIILRSENE